MERLFVALDTANLCEEELFQNVKVGLVPKWAQQKKRACFVAQLICQLQIRFLIDEERSLKFLFLNF